MSDRFLHLMHLNPKELANYLAEKGYPPLKSQDIYHTVVGQQERNKRDKRKGAAVAREWERVLPALRREKKVVRAMMQYKNHADPEAQAKRQEAIETYYAVLDKLLTELNGYKSALLTPLQAIEMLAKREDKKPRYVHNKGDTWVDWVPEKVRIRIEGLFEAIPQRFRAKVKKPFVVVDEHFDTKKLEMLVAIRKEWVAQLKIYEAIGDQTTEYALAVREHIDKLERALDMAIDLDEKKGDHIPRTWHGFFKGVKPSTNKDPFSVFY